MKKEAKVLDEEKEKVIDEINKKRKEDMKFVNQYLEQQNIEYKKMMSSNERTRFKFKKKILRNIIIHLMIINIKI